MEPDDYPQVTSTTASLRGVVSRWRTSGETVALVPTMGALHEGHLALVNEARSLADHVVVSIFVNPTQFAPGEDLGRYPRTWNEDLAALAGRADLVFAPSAEEMYPEGFVTSVHVDGPALGLEGVHRPGFFSGVATIVAKLLLACLPDSAMFGEKDYQQLLVVRRMVADLGIPTEIVGAPTVREADGLALSSRNGYLSADQRTVAPELHRALKAAADAIRAGAPVDAAEAEGRRRLEAAGFTVDYLEIRDAETLGRARDISDLRILAAARLGTTRLIDNIPVQRPSSKL